MEEIKATLDLIEYCLSKVGEVKGGSYYKAMAIKQTKYLLELMAKV
jgi:hypothetical protein